MEEQSIINKLIYEKLSFTPEQLETLERISKETFGFMMREYSNKDAKDTSDMMNKGPGFKREDLGKIYGKLPEPSSLYPHILMQQKLDRSENDVFKSKLPAINKYLKDMVDFTNFMINEDAVKKDSKTMSTRKRNLEQMIKEHNMKLQRKYGFDVSTYKDISIDKVIIDIIDYPPIESGLVTTMKSNLKNSKEIITLKFDKQIDDKDDIGHLFDFRTFVKPHLILSLINYMAIKFNSLSGLTLKNISIVSRPTYVYGDLLDRFFVVFEFTKKTKESNKTKTTKKGGKK
jgi:hypothetical protein